MLLTQRITELCMTSKDGVMPFAVFVEQGESCAWSIASGETQLTNQRWKAHILASKERRPDEWWVLDAWKEWLNDLCQEPSERRWRALKNLEKTTPGVVVRKPRNVQTRLPVGAIASRWQRNRLFNRAEVIAAEIAVRLAREGTAHWASSLTIDDHKSLIGDWIIERQPTPGKITVIHAESQAKGDGVPEKEPALKVKTSSASGLSIIQSIKANQIDEIKFQWMEAKASLGNKYPYGVAIVRQKCTAEVLETGCIVGEGFPAPVSLAVATVRSQWHASSLNGNYEEDGKFFPF